MTIRLRDNRFGAHGELINCDDATKSVLRKFGNKTLQELVEFGAVIDISNTHLAKNKRENLPFFSCNKTENGGVRLDTGNLMGVLKFREAGVRVQVEVLSRFDNGNNNFFLNYLLSRAFDVAWGNEHVAATNPSVLDLLLDLAFVRRLGEAARGGMFRQYRIFRNNDWEFRGRLDITRHIRENMPQMRGIAYEKREMSIDVPVNRMLLLAAMAIKKRRPELFERNEGARDALRTLYVNISTPGDVRTALSYRDCREPIIHPFHRDRWESVRQLARMILEEERWTLFNEADAENVCGVVFDGSWLWEEYLASVLVPMGFRHCMRGGEGLPLYRVSGKRKFYPDFYLPETAGRKSVIFDAKYKRFAPNGQRSDVHQIFCYLLLSGATLGGLLFPPIDQEVESDDDRNCDEYRREDNGWSQKKELNTPYSSAGNPICWSCFSFAAVPSNISDWNAFNEYMEAQEEKLVSGIKASLEH